MAKQEGATSPEQQPEAPDSGNAFGMRDEGHDQAAQEAAVSTLREAHESGSEVGETPAKEAEGKLLAGKYKTPDDLANAYGELETRVGTQGSELGATRKALEEAISVNRQWQEYYAAVPAATPAAGSGGDEDGKVDHWSDLANERAAAYEDLGMDADTAWNKAASEVQKMRRAYRAELSVRTKPYDDALNTVAANRNLANMLGTLATETRADGQPTRPDFKEISEGPEFASLWRAHGQPTDRNGLELVYFKARTAIQASSETRSAEDRLRTEKSGAGVGPTSGPRAGVAEVQDDDQQELERMYGHVRGGKGDVFGIGGS